MTVDLTVVPGLVLLASELIVLAAVGYIVVRVALRQDDQRIALAQGLVVGPAIWCLVTNFVLYAISGLAGSAVGWGLFAAIGVALVWRATDRIRPEPRLVVGMAVAVMALLWLALASRQTMSIVDPQQHLGIAASLRAGTFPPEFSWSPGPALRYHYGVEMLVGLLRPPAGPDPAFVSEILGAYFWTGLALVMVTSLHRRGGWFAVVVVAPLLLTAGAWTWRGMPIVVAAIPPVAADLPSGVLSFLEEAFWPTPPENSTTVALHDIWLPAFTFAYALALVVLERAVQSDWGHWLPRLTLAALVGSLGLIQTGVLGVVLTLWVCADAVNLVRLMRAGADLRGAALK